MLLRSVCLVVCFQEAEHAEHGALLLLSSSDGPLCLAVASALIKYQATGLLIFLIYASGLRILGGRHHHNEEAQPAIDWTAIS